MTDCKKKMRNRSLEPVQTDDRGILLSILIESAEDPQPWREISLYESDANVRKNVQRKKNMQLFKVDNWDI